MERKRTFEVGLSLASLAVLSQALFGAFSYSTRKEIRQRDKVCIKTKKNERLECAHINHNKGSKKYDDPSNGRLLHVTEHYKDHWNRHATRGIGLTIEQNIWALEQIWQRLTKEEQDEFRKKGMCPENLLAMM